MTKRKITKFPDLAGKDPVLVMPLEKKWSPEARAAAMAARRGKGKGGGGGGSQKAITDEEVEKI